MDREVGTYSSSSSDEEDDELSEQENLEIVPELETKIDERDDRATLPFDSSALSAVSTNAMGLSYRLNPNMETVVLYKGRKYNWNAKVNLHVHIVEHPYANTIEVIGYNTNTFSEAEHIFISSSYVYQKAEDPDVEEKVDLVLLEYQKLKLKIIPSVDTIKEALQRQRAATYILDRLHVVTKPTFHIDIKESDKNYRISTNLKPGSSSDSRRNSSVDTSIDAVGSHSISLSIRKPDTVVPSSVKRVGKSTTLIGDVVSVKLVKEDEQLSKIITTLNSSSFNNQAKRILGRVSLMQRNSTSGLPGSSTQQANAIANLRRRGGIFQASNLQNTANLKYFAKFKNDNDLLQESLSFLHVGDMMEMLCVCKRWQQVLSYALRSLNVMVITSKDYYHHCNLDRDVVINRVDYVESRHRRLMQLGSSLVSRPKSVSGAALTGQKKRKSHGNQHHEANENNSENSGNEEEEKETEERRRSFDSTEERFVEDYHQHLAQPNRHGLGSNFNNHNNLLVMPNRSEWPMLRAPQKFLLRKVYCRPETVQLLVRNASRSISELRLHYVILNRDTIAALASLTGRLKTLILGTIKIDDSVKETSVPAVPEVALPHPSVSNASQRATSSGSVIKPPDQSAPSQRSVLQHGRKVSISTEATNAEKSSASPSKLTAVARPHKAKPARKMRFMDSEDLGEILFACGSGLTHLEVSLTIGDISPSIFKLMPNLTRLVAQNTLLAPTVAAVHNEFEGNVILEEVVTTLMGIPMPDLLTLMSDSPNEAFCLTDRRGKVVTVNSAWERVFGHSRVDIVGSNIDFLAGPLTDGDEFDIILQGLKSQLRSEEVTTFVYTKDEQPVLVQIILIPNLSKWKGLPLNFDCLEPDKIGEMALEQEEALKQKENMNGGLKKTKQKMQFEKGKKDWRSTNRELSYHLLRFGLLSTAFVPYQNATHKMR